MEMLTRCTWLLILFLCLVVNDLSGQQTLSGVVLDSDGLPLIGATVMIKGTARGVISDFDGKYSIECSPGETLVISYTGYPTTETILTDRSFRNRKNRIKVKQTEVRKITSSAYQNAIKAYRDSAKIEASPSQKFKTQNRINNFQKIKDIEFEEDKVSFKLSEVPWKYQIGFNQKMGFSFLSEDRLPAIQTRFAGGNNTSGDLTLLESNAAVPQAFGPAFSNLSYDGIQTATNPAGQLIFDANGNGVQTAMPDIFPAVLLSTTGLNFKMTRDDETIYLRLNNQIGKDVFGVQPYRNNRVGLSFNKRLDDGQLTFKGAWGRNRNDQSNRYGLASRIYEFAYQSPTEFPLDFESNRMQNITAAEGFADNPFYLLEEALDQNISTRWNVGAAWNQTFSYSKLSLRAQSDISGSHQKIGFIPGQKQVRDIPSLKQNYQSPNWQNQLELKYRIDSRFYTKLIARHNFEKLNYDYKLENSPEEFLNLKRNNLDIITQFQYEGYYNDLIDKVQVYNQILSSSYGKQKFFLPGISVRLRGDKLIREVKFINELLVNLEFNRAIYQQPLLYQNRAWNYSELGAFNSTRYLVYPELATPENMELETRTNFNGGLSIFTFDNSLRFMTRYYYSLRKDVVGHRGSLENTRIENLATLREQGFEIDLSFGKSFYNRNRKNLNAQLIFELNRSKVVGLVDETEEVIMGGNLQVQQVLKKGDSSGALRGTTWLRNENGDLIIDEGGYPMVNLNPSIIGDALPDFRLKFNLEYEKNRFFAGLNLTYSKGGDAWNGTLASLDYLGLSQNSADLRETRDFTFSGVKMDGTMNSTPVNFGESNGLGNLNRWQRYGPGGVGEAYIEDASFLSLSYVFLGYKFLEEGNIFNKISLKIYGNNLVAWLPFSGFSPYRTFLDLDATTGIQYFNLPMNSEVGITLKVEI